MIHHDSNTVPIFGSKKVIDCFIFFKEIDLLRVRLEYLGDQIDHFIIIEANIDFSGKPKKYYLENHVASLPFAKKIIYHKLEINKFSIPWIFKKLRWISRPHKYLWKIQDEQRDAVSITIKKNQLVADFVLFGDLDEIPNYEFVKSLCHNNYLLNKPKTLRQRLFYYHPENAEVEEKWLGTICAPLDQFMAFPPHQLRSMRENFESIEDGGYHFSYFMRPKEIKDKMEAIANVERINNFLGLTLQDIQNRVRENKDLYDRKLLFHENTVIVPDNLKKLLYKYMFWLI